MNNKTVLLIILVSIVTISGTMNGYFAWVINEKDSQIFDSNLEVNILSSEVSQLQGQLAQKNSEIDNLNSEITELNNQIINKTAEITDLQTQVTQKSAEVATLNSQITNLNVQVNNLTEDLAQKDNSIQSLNQQISDLNSSYLELVAEYDDLLFHYDLVNGPVSSFDSVGDLQITFATSRTVYYYQDSLSGNITISYLNGTAFDGNFDIHISCDAGGYTFFLSYEIANGYGEFLINPPKAFHYGPGIYTVFIYGITNHDGFKVATFSELADLSVQVEAK